ncbi:MAG: ferredoxin [Myxococcota bacterium]|nr:ferredoxin [Myxococcota bacterium]
MRIRLDPERCTGHERCYSLTPEIFDEDERGRCVVVVADVPAEQREAAERGVEACPEQALSIEAIAETGA